MATLQRPWLWAVYVFTIGLPVILFISFMWPDKVNGNWKRIFGKRRSAAVKEVTCDGFACRGSGPLINPTTTRSLMTFNQMILTLQPGVIRLIAKVTPHSCCTLLIVVGSWFPAALSPLSAQKRLLELQPGGGSPLANRRSQTWT